MNNIKVAGAFLKKNLKGDPIIWTIIFLLSIISVLVVYSAVYAQAHVRKGGDTEYYLIKHVILILLSFFATWVAHNINYKYYAGISKMLLWLAVPLLLYTHFFGLNINGASRWLSMPGGLTFQTSDLAKLALITNLTSMLAKRQSNIDDFKKALSPVLLWCGVICGLIALSDLGTSLTLFMTCMLLMFISRVPLKQLGVLVFSGSGALFLALALGNRLGTAISRLTAWWDTLTGATGIASGLGYQVESSMIAMATGGFWGVGAAHSQQKYFLPEAFSDYVFAILIEEYGMLIGICVLFLYLALLYRGMKTAANSDKAFGGLLSAGLSFSLVLQALINMAVVVGIGPVTGMPLPFISMGGTSLLFTGFSLGIILSVSRVDEARNHQMNTNFMSSGGGNVTKES